MLAMALSPFAALASFAMQARSRDIDVMTPARQLVSIQHAPAVTLPDGKAQNTVASAKVVPAPSKLATEGWGEGRPD